MERYRGYRYRSYKHRSDGHERALQHIREAESLSRELGGTGEEVKEYFFSLPTEKLKLIMKKYENLYGPYAREYAEETLPKWKSGKVHMSGMVTTRLFNLLPPTMPLQEKYCLTEKLWKHVGPSSSKTLYVGLDADLDEVVLRIEEYLKRVVIPYKIPDSMEARFEWLSQGDVQVKQKLLNYLQKRESQLLTEVLSSQLPLLLKHLKSDKGSLTTHVAQFLNVGKHEVRVIVNELVDGISETAPVKTKKRTDYGCVWLFVICVIVLWFLGV
jgi:hypothetical protein